MRRFGYLAVCVALICARPLPAKEPPSLWILSGQSNACGRARLPGPQAHPLVTMFNPAKGAFVVAEDPLPHMGTRGTGPWVAAAQQVATALKTPVKMCGFASGGKPIEYWNPGKPGHKGLFPVIARAGQGANVFLWYQGESNAGGRLNSLQYQTALVNHVKRVRQAARNPEMLVVIVQLGPTLSKGRGGYMAIREAQRRFVVKDRRAILVPALGRTLKDTVHLDNAGYRELGKEIGRALLRVRHKKTAGHWPGPVLDDAVLQTKGRYRNIVVAHFAEVKQLKGVTLQDFAVLDEEGTNRAAKILQVNKTTVRIQLARDVVLPAQLIYGFGQRPNATLTDEAGNRAPAVHQGIRTGTEPQDVVTQMANGAGK